MCHKKETYKNCLKGTQLENEINYLEKNKIDIDSIKEFIKNNKSIWKVQQKFKRNWFKTVFSLKKLARLF